MQSLSRSLEDVDRLMESVALSGLASDSLICRAVCHHLRSGGQRVRARFCVDAALKLRATYQQAVALATACELLHNASLIQDDLLDRAPMRRGQASVWAQFGDTAAVCAGDLLLAAAFAVLCQSAVSSSLQQCIALVYERTQKVVAGQTEEQELPCIGLAEYEKLAIGKSASLLSLTLELPLLAAGQQNCIAAAREAAACFAAAYQMADDLVDYEQDARAHTLNAVAVLAAAGHPLRDARRQVAERAVALLEAAIEIATLLPENCALSMIEYAQQALIKLKAGGDLSSHVSGVIYV